MDSFQLNWGNARQLISIKLSAFLLAAIVALVSLPVSASYEFTVGVPKVFYHDTSLQHVGDSYFSCNELAPGLICYTGNGTTRFFSGTDLDNMQLGDQPVIGKGLNDSFDECGAWLQNGIQVGSRLLGYYHGESECIYKGDGRPQTIMRMFYAESFDGGLTFVKTENNVIASSTYTSETNRIKGRGNGSVVEFNNQLMMAVVDVTDHGWRTEIASADPATPDQFTLVKNGVPAIDGVGESDSFVGASLIVHKGVKPRLAVLAIHAGIGEEASQTWAFNSTGSVRSSNRYRAIPDGLSASIQQREDLVLDLEKQGLNFDSEYATPYGGIALTYYDAYSNTFQKQETPPLVYGTNLDWADRNNGELFSYPSIVGMRNGKAAGKEFQDQFNLIYTYAHNGESFQYRRIVMQPVTVKHTGNSENTVKTTLSVYRNQATGDRWSTAKLPTDGYTWTENLGYIFTEKNASRKPLYEFVNARGRHFLTGSYAEDFGTFVRISGWLERKPTSKASMALIRQFNPVNGVHTHTTKHYEDIAIDDYVLGYIVPLQDPGSDAGWSLPHLPLLMEEEQEPEDEPEPEE